MESLSQQYEVVLIWYKELGWEVIYMQVIIYSTTTCPYCKMLKEYFDEKGVEYTEKLVDKDDSARDEMSEASGGFLGVPFTVVTKDDGTKETIVGFDKGKIESVLGIN